MYWIDIYVFMSRLKTLLLWVSYYKLLSAFIFFLLFISLCFCQYIIQKIKKKIMSNYLRRQQKKKTLNFELELELELHIGFCFALSVSLWYDMAFSYQSSDAEVFSSILSLSLFFCLLILCFWWQWEQMKWTKQTKVEFIVFINILF